MLGVGLLIAAHTELFTVIKLAGAAYLVYIGLRTFFARADLTVDLASKAALSRWGALRTGFLTNVLNPKTTLFVVSTFTQVVGPDTPLWQQAGYGMFMSLAHLAWFALVALFFSHTRLRTSLLRAQKALNRTIGATLVGLGVTLGVTSP
jgi:threonine/homoserine/homoserine lactone efflux protein